MITVAPLAGAWIEIVHQNSDQQQDQSLPSRERGLKFDSVSLCYLKQPGRSPRGSVD